jgi:hypothetical protein
MTTRRIFRESAVRRYNERLERVELPRYATMPWTRLAWAVGGLMLLLAALLSATRLPFFAVGPGVVIHNDATDGTAVAALLPAEYAAQLRLGQTAQLSLMADSAPEDALSATVTAVEPMPLSPAAVRARYGLDAATGALVEGPVAVVLLSFNLPADQWEGSVADVRIEVGSRSVLSLVPGLDRLLAIEPANADGE